MIDGIGYDIARPLPWLSSFDVGDPRIDAEHRALLSGCNELCRLAAHGARHGDLRVAIRELIVAVESHFASEEALFPHIRFPAVAQHIAEHDAIRRALPRLLPLPLLPDSQLAPHVAALRTMLVEHMLHHDLAYKTWVEEALRS